ncbi:hypothetical protein ACAN107058_17550 [Paracidovorax anthurii]
MRRQPRGPRGARRRLQGLPRRGDEPHGLPVRAGAGLGRLQRAGLQRRAHRRGHGDAVAVEDAQGIGAGGGIGHRGAAGDHRRVVARHVADGQRHHPRRRARRREPPALDAREVLAHAVHLRDARAALQQGLVDALLVRQRQALGGKRQQRGTAPRDQADHEVVGREPPGQRQHAPRRRLARRVGHGMGRLHDLDARRHPLGPGRHVAVARDHEARERSLRRPQRLQRVHHRAARLARAQHQRAAPGRRRQVLRHALQRQRGPHGGVVEVAQEAHGLGGRIGRGEGGGSVVAGIGGGHARILAQGPPLGVAIRYNLPPHRTHRPPDNPSPPAGGLACRSFGSVSHSNPESSMTPTTLTCRREGNGTPIRARSAI